MKNFLLNFIIWALALSLSLVGLNAGFKSEKFETCSTVQRKASYNGFLYFQLRNGIDTTYLDETVWKDTPINSKFCYDDWKFVINPIYAVFIIIFSIFFTALTLFAFLSYLCSWNFRRKVWSGTILK